MHNKKKPGPGNAETRLLTMFEAPYWLCPFKTIRMIRRSNPTNFTSCAGMFIRDRRVFFVGSGAPDKSAIGPPASSVLFTVSFSLFAIWITPESGTRRAMPSPCK